jgi:hypothetical protein
MMYFHDETNILDIKESYRRTSPQRKNRKFELFSFYHNLTNENDRVSDVLHFMSVETEFVDFELLI